MNRDGSQTCFIFTMQALLHAKGMIRKLLGNQELTTNIEESKEGSSLIPSEIDGIKGNNATIDSDISGNMSELLLQVVEWLSRAEVLQSLLSSNVTASLDDVLDKQSAETLRDRLIDEERYNMAVYCCTKCKVRSP
jgi:zinc finger FYVE domain-containing protein 26